MTKNQILKLRKEKKLHEFVENRLVWLFKKIAHGSFTLKEGIGTTSGRTDTTTFLGNGKIVHVEIITSVNMVPRDLNNLHQSSAELKIAVLIDEFIDASVPEAYFRVNAKNLFPQLWLSDVIDEKREDFVLGCITQLIQNLERLVTDNMLRTKEKFTDFIDKFNNSLEPISSDKSSIITTHLGLFPRKILNLYGDLTDERGLFSRFEPYGIVNASDPFGFVAGANWFFSQNGKFFTVQEPPMKSSFGTLISVGREGEIIFSYFDSRNAIENFSASSLEQLFNPTFTFASSLYKNQNYVDIVDVLGLIVGTFGKGWLSKEDEKSHLAQIIRGRDFYENEIILPTLSQTVEEIEDENSRQKIFDKIFTQLKINTKERPWK